MANPIIPEETKNKIIDKKELSGLQPEFLDTFLEQYFKKHNKDLEILKEKNFNERSKEFKELKKHIRKKLREVHGVFNKNKKSTTKKQEPKQEIISLLEQHQSTKERLSSFQEIYKKALKQKNLRILDLGCGYNPLFFLLLNTKINCVAIDINSKELETLKEIYQKNNEEIQTIQADITSQETQKQIEKISKNIDVTLMLKLLDSLETKKRGTTKELLNKTNSKEILISFATKTIGGKKEIKGERKWFQEALNKSKYKLKETIETRNEKYYVLKQENSKE